MREPEPKENTDWLKEGDNLRERGLWEEALTCYRKALDLSCGDSVGWRDGHAAELGMKECLRNLTGLLRLVLEGFSPRVARDAKAHAGLAEELKARQPGRTVDALADLLAWAVSLDAPALEAAVRPHWKTPGAVPVEIIRRYLAEVGKQLGKSRGSRH